jgi:hypothetical protein
VLLKARKVEISPKKIEAIRDEKPPSTRKGIRRFLGITNYHRKFIKGYSAIARPLHDLTKDVQFLWSEACDQAFKTLKEALILAPVLALPRDEGRFQLKTDASDVATGAVLYQEQEDGSLRPVGYSSRSYNDAEKNHTTYDKEMLAIMRALDEWRSLLIGTSQLFEIHMDHRNLTYFRDPQKLTSRQANWTTKLQDFDFVIKHIAGRSNVSADTLSRPDGEEKPERRTDIMLLDRLFVHYLARKDLEDPVKDEITNKRKEEIISNHHDVPAAGHPGIKRTHSLITRKGHHWKGLRKDVTSYVQTCQICQKNKLRIGPVGLELHPFNIPKSPWEVMAWDLIGPLPESWTYNAIITMVDVRTKAIKLELADVTIMARGAAVIMKNRVFARKACP